MLTSTIPMYAAEISESKYRGALSGALQWFLSWGFFAAQWIGYGCQHVKGPFSCKQRPSMHFWVNLTPEQGASL